MIIIIIIDKNNKGCSEYVYMSNSPQQLQKKNLNIKKFTNTQNK